MSNGPSIYGMPPWLWIYGVFIKLWMVSFVYGIAFDIWTMRRIKKGLPPPAPGMRLIGGAIDRLIDAHYVRQFRKDLMRHRHA